MDWDRPLLDQIGEALGPSWATRATEQTQRDIDAYQSGGTKALLANTQNTQDLAGGFGAGTIRAYHGSPFKFDKFEASHIGSGEGHQSYGHGLYFAENPKVAETYRHVPDDEAPEMNPGHLYEVEINAEPEQFLDWDKPLAEQSASVKQAYQNVFGKPDPKLAEVRVRETDDLMHQLASDRDPVTNQMRDEPKWFSLARLRDKAWAEWNRVQSGHNAYDATASASAMRENPIWNDVAPNTNRRAAASELLHKQGVPGIKYLDQWSRPGAQGTSNYVVFDPDIVNIKSVK